MAKKNVLTRAKKQQALEFLQQGNPVGAKPLLEKICRTDRSDTEAQFMLGMAQGMLGEQSKAEHSFRQVLKRSPDHPEANNNLGLSIWSQGRSQESLAWFERALHLSPDNVEFMFNYANAFEGMGELKQASVWYEKTIARRPDYPDAWCNLGNVLQAQGEYVAAVAAFEHAISLSADFAHHFPQIFINLGNALMELGRSEEALQAYQDAVHARSDYVGAYLALGNAYLQHGRREAATGALRHAISLNPQSGGAYRNLAETKRFQERDSDVEAMEKLFQRDELDSSDKTELAFALGKVYGDLKEDAKSFDYYLQGNHLKRQSLDYSIEKDRALFSLIKQTFTPEFLQQHQGIGLDDPAPIFIIGMPRSGTSLTEQILASHSQVHGAGELNDLRIVIEHACDEQGENYPSALMQLDNDELLKIATVYLERLHAYMPTAPRITDKMPHNFLYVGLIHLLLPKAKIIHCQRNPMDNALSIFKVLFSAGKHAYAYSLEELGQYYHLYQNLMAHWRRLLPGAFYDLVYEDLVSDQEEQTRRLLEYCELPWEETCLAFHRTERVVRTASLVQVRQPMHASSVEGWRRVEQQMQPFVRALHEGDGDATN